jgi:uncharacterized membrane protein
MSRIEGKTVAAIGMAIGLCGLGVLSLAYQDFALQGEPVPKSLPGHDALGAASGALLLAAGLMLLSPRTRAWGLMVAATFLAFWALVLHLPLTLPKPLEVGGWNGVAEPLAMAGGAFIAGRELKGRSPRWAVYVMAACFVTFGLAHFAYARFTASMIPDWLPLRVPLAYFTGAIHAGTGLAVLVGVRRRWAASIEALMMSSFVLLVHVPRVAAHPTVRLELTMLFIAITLSSAVWLFATSQSVRPGSVRDG